MGAKIFDGQKWVDVYDTITDNYSLLLVSTTDESLLGKPVTVTATGEGAKREEYTKRFTALNAQPFFRLNQITTYTVTCGDEVRTVTVSEYGNYTIKIIPFDGLLFDAGDERLDATGGWINVNGKNFSNTGTALRIESHTSGTFETCRTSNPIDLTEWNYLYIDGQYSNAASYDTGWGEIGFGTETEAIEVKQFGKRKNHYMDISNVVGSHYIHFGCAGSSYYSYAYKIWLTKELIEE